MSLSHHNSVKKAIKVLVSGLSFYAGCALASQTLADVATQVTSTFGAVAQLITAMAYVAGMGFAIGAILKFKQHKDNPTQIPIGTPIAMLFVAAAMIFLPTIFSVAGQTLFGTGAAVGGVTGVTTFS